MGVVKEAIADRVRHRIEDVLAACAIHGWSPGPSRFGSALPCWSATPLTPAARQVHLTSSSPTTTAFTPLRPARLTASPPANGFTRVLYFGAAGIPSRCGPPARSPPWPFGTASQHPGTLYTRAFCRFVASSTVEYATRPTGRLPGRDLRPLDGQPFSAAPKCLSNTQRVSGCNVC